MLFSRHWVRRVVSVSYTHLDVYKRQEAYQSEADLEKEFIRLLCELGYERLTKMCIRDSWKASSHLLLKRVGVW